MSVWTGGGLTTFSAWVGLVPKQNSSGGKDKLGSISKQGDRYLRIHGWRTCGDPLCQDPRAAIRGHEYFKETRAISKLAS
jgi:transposase IS116/IS110/IS902 family protein